MPNAAGKRSGPTVETAVIAMTAVLHARTIATTVAIETETETVIGTGMMRTTAHAVGGATIDPACQERP
jgi:hypothetical protein